jgi:hypothetical protein
VTRLGWGAPGTREYEVGVDRGVLYLDGMDGVPWVGLTSVVERPSGGDPRPYFMDGEKYLNLAAREQFEATITAFTYPDEFGFCDGTYPIRPGLRFAQQRRKQFGLSYRVKVGNDLSPNSGYRIHLVYNALAAPSQRQNNTMGDSSEVADFSWDITTRPVATAGFRRTAHVVIDSRETNPVKYKRLEDILYGNDLTDPRLPTPLELIELYDDPLSFTLTDNGDGTFTIVAPNDALESYSNGQFVFDWETATPVDDETYTITS